MILAVITVIFLITEKNSQNLPTDLEVAFRELNYDNEVLLINTNSPDIKYFSNKSWQKMLSRNAGRMLSESKDFCSECINKVSCKLLSSNKTECVCLSGFFGNNCKSSVSDKTQLYSQMNGLASLALGDYYSNRTNETDTLSQLIYEYPSLLDQSLLSLLGKLTSQIYNDQNPKIDSAKTVFRFMDSLYSSGAS